MQKILQKTPFMRTCRKFENRFTRFIRKVFATKILLSGKFSLFVTLDVGPKNQCSCEIKEKILVVSVVITKEHPKF